MTISRGASDWVVVAGKLTTFLGSLDLGGERSFNRQSFTTELTFSGLKITQNHVFLRMTIHNFNWWQESN